ncbi:hypothetical protein GRF29_28g2356509 [Pseudopithomyces chartarum]|uniref:Peroxisomal membrane protein PEX17 n=1 Tax=Pseudopithomyces chartarum TaxID=1892770 RepID=A0AAN6M1V0_9PLEO|nr:hypothetical protein GRF29_28g2356509 [Pseudopithomyces chartarum]
MPADRLLSTLLRSLQTYTDQQDTPRILGTASSLLTSLGNPHNLSLLTSHLLTAPALWDRPEGLRTPLRLISVFHSALTAVINHHNDVRWDKAAELLPGQTPIGGGLSLDEWVRAIVAGADERSQRWRHLVALGGLLVAIGSLEEQGMELYWASGIRKRIEGALVRAMNLALVEISFSEIDSAEEATFLEEEALHKTVPLLWNLLKAALFATTITLRGVMIRTLGDKTLAGDAVAPVVASQVLQTLRHLYFITSRLGPAGFSQHTFVYLTAIDILSAYPPHSDKFLKIIAPPHLGQIPRHPLDRTLDLYFLNTAEHFSLVLPLPQTKTSSSPPPCPTSPPASPPPSSPSLKPPTASCSPCSPPRNQQR